MPEGAGRLKGGDMGTVTLPLVNAPSDFENNTGARQDDSPLLANLSCSSNGACRRSRSTAIGPDDEVTGGAAIFFE
jgi:hypothetical protein